MNAEDHRGPLLPSHLSYGRNVPWIASVALVYFVAARLSLLLEFQPEGIAAIWPPEGVFLSAILLTRRELRFYLVGTLCISDFVAQLLAGTPFLVSAIYALTLTGTAVLSSWLLLRFVGEPITFMRVREVFGFLALAVILSNSLWSLVAAAASMLLPGTSSFWNSWKWWAASDGIGNLLTTPFLLSWASWARSKVGTWNPKRAMEGAALFIPLALLNFFAFSHLSEPGLFSLLLPYVTFPFLLWAALRFGVRGVTSALVILAAIAVSFAAMGPIPSFPFQDFPLNGVIIIQLYLAVIAVPSLFLGAVVTERKQAEESLRQSEEKYRGLFQNMAEGFALYELLYDERGKPVDWRILEVNDAYTRHTGVTRERIAGRRISEVFPAAMPEYLPRFAEVVATQIPLGFETYAKHVGRHQHVVTFPAGGHRFASIIEDITERKRAEEALRESEERFRTAFEEGAVPMALTSLDSTLLKVNAAFCRMLGFSESELIGKSWAEVTHPEDREANLVGTRQLACGEVSSFRMEKRYIRKDGTVLWADMSTASVRDANGQPLYCVTHVQDVTDRKQAEEALRELNAALENKVAQRTAELEHRARQLQQLTLELSQVEDRERKRLADLLHDEVQQILAAARFHLNLLSSATMSADESQEIVERVRQMLRDAIGKARRLSHEISPVPYQVDLIEVMNWLARHMRQDHGLTVHVEAHGQVDSSSEPLKTFLYKVAQELLFNVIKHAGVNEARIRLRRMGRCIYLSVIDQGRGFDPQGLKETRGFGLLSIRERVQLLGGRMKIRSVRNRGSRFLIEVPDEGASPVSSQTERREE